MRPLKRMSKDVGANAPNVNCNSLFMALNIPSPTYVDKVQFYGDFLMMASPTNDIGKIHIS